MDEKELIFQQYKLYTEQKDSFINRSFSINIFYFCLAVLLLLLVNYTEGLTFAYSVPLNALLAIIGMSASILWWMNMDSYNMLIKIKFSKVIEEIEKQLPIQPFHSEYLGIKEYRDNKKMFIFSDIQKTVAVVMFLIFFVSLIENIIPVFIKYIG